MNLTQILCGEAKEYLSQIHLCQAKARRFYSLFSNPSVPNWRTFFSIIKGIFIYPDQSYSEWLITGFIKTSSTHFITKEDLKALFTSSKLTHKCQTGQIWQFFCIKRSIMMSKIHTMSQEILVIHIAPTGSSQENNTLTVWTIMTKIPHSAGTNIMIGSFISCFWWSLTLYYYIPYIG